MLQHTCSAFLSIQNSGGRIQLTAGYFFHIRFPMRTLAGLSRRNAWSGKRGGTRRPFLTRDTRSRGSEFPFFFRPARRPALQTGRLKGRVLSCPSDNFVQDAAEAPPSGAVTFWTCSVWTVRASAVWTVRRNPGPVTISPGRGMRPSSAKT